MKNLRKSMSVVLILLVSLFCLSTVAFASTSEQDGLKVELTTDKENYSLNEDIKINVTVTNTNDVTVENVKIDTLLPEEFTLKDRNKSTSSEAVDIPAGKKIEFSVVAVVKDGKSDKTSSDTDSKLTGTSTNNKDNINKQNDKSPYTGKYYAVMTGFSALFIIGIVLLILCLKRNRKKTSKAVSSALCLVLAVTSFIGLADFKAKADNKIDVNTSINETNDFISDNTFTVGINKKITIDGHQKNILATAQYNGYVELKYDLCGISAENPPENQIVKIGKYPFEPEMPLNDEYVFMGWYTSKDYNEHFCFSKEMLESTTIYAKWEKVDHSILENELKELNKVGSDQFKFEKDIFDRDEKNAINSVQVDYYLENGTGVLFISEDYEAITNGVVGLIGRPVNIDLYDDSLEKSNIIFNYDKNKLPSDVDENNLGIMWFDEENMKMVLLENSIVNTENHTVSVETNHFSTYMLVDTSEWLKAWEHKQLVSRDKGKSLRYDIVLCLDCSGSMSGTATNMCQSSAITFVDQLVDGDCIAVVGFNSTAQTIVVPTNINGQNSKDDIKSLINLNATGGTNFDNALSKSIELLNSMPESGTSNEIYKKYIVFISDGEDNTSDSKIAELVEYGYNVIAIGVGNSVSESVLKNLAEKSGGSYAYVSDPNDISTIFQQIQGEYIGLTQDSDNDKIADLVEESGMIDVKGHIYKTDSYNNDTDGDGISDGEEMGMYDDELGCFVINSSPTTPTNFSDKAKVELSANYCKTKTLSLDLDNYITRKIKFQIKCDSLVLAQDYLSETVHSDAKDVKISVETTSGGHASKNIGTIKAGSTYKGDFTLSTDNINDFVGTITITVSGSNFESKEYKLQYNIYQDYCKNLDTIVTNKEKELKQKGTKAIRAFSNSVKGAENKLDSMVTLVDYSISIGNGATPKKLINKLHSELANIYKNKALEYSQKKKNLFSSYDAEDVIKAVANEFSSETNKLAFKIGNLEYKATINNTSYMYAGFGTVNVNASNGKKYSFVFSSTYENAINALNDYMNECKYLYNESLKKCIETALSDSAKILELDLIKQFVESQCDDIINKYLAKANVGFKIEDLRTYYNYYDTAKNAINDCINLENPTAFKLVKAQKSVEELLTFQF